ncbi:hypothetical protein [Paenibacillus naphthalenovorans]|nr:hypothetical protein [Paenibacillus naphthalenovorans]
MKIDQVEYEILKVWVEMLECDETAAVIDEMKGLIAAYEQS